MITSKGLRTTLAPSKCRLYCANIKTIAQAIERGSPSISRIRKEAGDVPVRAYLAVWIMGLNESINCKRPLKESQIDTCADLIVEEYSWVTIADINLVFKWAKMGRYGELFETMSIDKILGWFNDYYSERCEIAGEISRKKAEERKRSEASGEGNVLSGGMIELLKEVTGYEKREVRVAKGMVYSEEKLKQMKDEYFERRKQGDIQDGIQEGDSEESNKEDEREQ